MSSILVWAKRSRRKPATAYACYKIPSRFLENKGIFYYSYVGNFKNLQEFNFLKLVKASEKFGGERWGSTMPSGPLPRGGTASVTGFGGREFEFLGPQFWCHVHF